MLCLPSINKHTHSCVLRSTPQVYFAEHHGGHGVPKKGQIGVDAEYAPPERFQSRCGCSCANCRALVFAVVLVVDIVTMYPRDSEHEYGDSREEEHERPQAREAERKPLPENCADVSPRIMPAEGDASILLSHSPIHTAST
jgi:hypothetical protein